MVENEYKEKYIRKSGGVENPWYEDFWMGSNEMIRIYDKLKGFKEEHKEIYRNDREARDALDNAAIDILSVDETTKACSPGLMTDALTELGKDFERLKKTYGVRAIHLEQSVNTDLIRNIRTNLTRECSCKLKKYW